jgi:hypothetical protein
MSKIQKTIRTKKKEPESGLGKFHIDNFIPSKYQTTFAFLLIAVLFIIFYAPIFFGGKTVVSGDIINGMSYKNFYAKAKLFLWDPYVFCGMPAFGKIGWYDVFGTAILQITHFYSSLFNSSYTMWTLYFFLLGIFFYSLMRFLKATLIVSIVVAIAAMFSTGIVVLYNIGHITKLLSLITFPLVILFLLKFNEKIKLLDVLFFLLTMHFLFMQWHVQIMFYIFYSIGIFYLYYLIRSFIIKDKNLRLQLIKSFGIFALITVIALGMNYYKLKQIYEYTPYSTRGTKSITDIEMKTQQQSSEEFYQYATNWSFSPGEIMTFFFPSYYGFGNSTYNGPLTNNQDYQVNTYFGQMPFVDVAQYMGVSVLALALFAMFLCQKNPLVQYLTWLIVISLLLSFGRTFPLLYDLFYYNFPFFDKFRAPSMILNIVQLSIPILAGIGLMKILSIKQNKDIPKEKLIKNIAFSISVLFAFALLINQGISSWFVQRVSDSGQRGEQLKPLYDYMSSMFVGDVLFSLAITAGIFWLAYLFIKEKISFDSLGLIVLILIVVDLWRVDYRGVNYVDPNIERQNFVMPPYLKVIKEQNNSMPYRLLNLKQDGSLGSYNQDNNFYVYFLVEDFNGYSGIKPRAYQDIIDVVGPANETLWRMLNVKYIITSNAVQVPGLNLIQDWDKTFLYQNENALPRAYFVDSVITAQPMEILNDIKNNSFDPKKVAFAEDEKINVDTVGANAYVKLTEYKDEKIDLDVNATGNNLLFLGDTYYPVGWKATIDGKPIQIHKINHGFMGVVVPVGQHKVEFFYHPASFFTGRQITLVFSIFVIVVFLWISIRKIKTKQVLIENSTSQNTTAKNV